VLCACASDAASADFAAIRDVLAKGRDIFVIDICDLVAAEAARLLLELLIFRALMAIGFRLLMRNGWLVF